MIDAATTLFSERGVSGVSVRDIAARARVNHGLVHRHFGSKEALRKAVLDRLAARILSEVAPLEGADLQTLLLHARERTSAHGAHFRILARAMLDGEDPANIQSRWPVAEMLVRAATEAGIEHPQQYVASQIATGLGWLLFEPWIRAATKLDKV